MPVETPYEDLERELRTLLRKASTQTTAMARRVHPDLDANAYPLLAYIESRPNLRAGDLTEHFGIGASTISRQLARLEDLGLITKRLDPLDYRVQLIGLTETGRQRIDLARQARVEFMRRVLAGWSTEDVAELASLLRRYSEDTSKDVGGDAGVHRRHGRQAADG